MREGILTFETGIGSWRVSTTRINYPTEKYKFKYNKVNPNTPSRKRSTRCSR